MQNPAASALADTQAPNRAATPRTVPPTLSLCRETVLRKRLTRARHRAAITRNRLEELEGQTAQARERLEQHRATARAAEAELLELDPDALAHVHDVSKGAVPR